MAKGPEARQRELDQMIEADMEYQEHEKNLLSEIADLCAEESE